MRKSGLSITLTDAQVTQILREAAKKEGNANLLSALGDPRALDRSALALIDDPRYSRATVRAVQVLCSFPTEPPGREVTDVARQLNMSPSTTHRYAITLVEIGFLERDPDSRRYWLRQGG